MSVHGQVAHEIGRKIVSGAIPEGAFLPREAELAERYRASRQAVREALKVLAAKGLVTSRRRAGTHVLPKSHWNLLDPDVIAWFPPGAVTAGFLRDLVEVRRAIEPMAAGFAAQRGSEESIAAIGEALEMMRAVEKPSDAFFVADVAFHDAVLSASGNVIIDRLSQIIGPLLRTSFELHFHGVIDALANPNEIRVAVDTSLDRHAAVYQAIRERDPARARAATEALLTQISAEVDFAVRGTGTGKRRDSQGSTRAGPPGRPPP
ncbi:MAG TPA: FadR/GntR family transcriptional regulator [Bauldia sp.]|nr:FadR/GntR family transcriptional regulator [Bauldia sp.]